MGFDELRDPALQEKLKAAKSPDEILALTKEEGYELGDAELDQIAGGGFWDYSGNSHRPPTTQG